MGEGDTYECAVQDHDRNLIIILERCREKNIKLNPKTRRRQEVPYVGHLLTPDGLRHDPNKVKAILEMPTPVDKKVNAKTTLNDHVSGEISPKPVTEPLRRSLDRDVEWHWDHTHQNALNQVKQLITRESVLRYFDKAEEVTLQCDASDSGLGAVIMQESQPVDFSSRALTNTGKNYAQIEKELLSIVHGCNRFDQYVYGRGITVQADHKPLKNIFKIPLLQAAKTEANVAPVTEVPPETSVQAREGDFNRGYTQSSIFAQ